MTREEAWDRIDTIIAKHEVDDAYVTIINYKDFDALRLARKLLEQEPHEDCISRQAVKEQMIKYGFHAPDMTVTEFVENLPAVTPNMEMGYLKIIKKIQKIVTEWKSDIWTDNLSYECMVKVAELFESQESEV